MFLFFFLGTLSGFAFGSESEQRITIGLGSTKLNYASKYESFTYKIGDSISYEAIKKFNKKQGLSLGMEINTIGARSSAFDYDINTTWLTIPLVYRYNALEKVTLLCGGYLASALKREYKDESGSENIDHIIKSSDYGLIFGAEYAFSKKLFVNAQWRMGLPNLNQSPYSSNELKTVQSRLSIGYTFYDSSN